MARPSQLLDVLDSGAPVADLKIFSIRNIYSSGMLRAGMTVDVFNVIAEHRATGTPRRSQGRPCGKVGKLANRLGIRQPAMSKRLGVLRKVGIVSANKQAQLSYPAINDF